MTRMLPLVAAVTFAVPAWADDAGTGARPSCVDVRPVAVSSGTGFFNHVVYVRNGCDRTVRCAVSTDANPAPSRVRIEPGHEEAVATFYHSPASGFRPRVDCEYVP